ncbi:MAG: hypothetical protein CMM58_01125 [Rhodospirillaceae bacterium]|nr:hypothetical protein [Rhodospirillaceae bacterium]|tara:strand:- start:3392 stop:3853 length:462 start_codon:yes stop_codon:yes gene_type:complete
MKQNAYVLPGAIIALSVAVIVAALNLEEAAPVIVGQGLQPRIFPIFLMVLNIFLALLMFWDFTRKAPNKIPMEGFPTYGSILLFGLFFILSSFVDMFIGIAVVMFLMCRLWGEKRLAVNLTLALVTPIFIFFLFDLVLKIRFPRGLLTDWYYG